MKTHFRNFILFCCLALPHACMDDAALWEPEPPRDSGRGKGVFIVNEGNFTYGNASLSYYDPQSREVQNEVFFRSNGLPLGDVAFSMQIRDSLGYIVVNNSGRIYIMDVNDFSYAGKITGLVSPRHILFLSDERAYVSDLYGRALALVNPRSMELSGSIDVQHPEGRYYQHSTEQLLQFENYVYTNCWSFDNQVLLIDTETDRVVDSVRVVKQPNSMVMDRWNNLWILSDGGFPESPYGYELPGLMKLAPGAREAELVFRFAHGERPSELSINRGGDSLFFLNRHVYCYVPSGPSDPEVLITSPYDAGFQGGYYGLGIDPDNSEIYVSDAIDYAQPGLVYRYSARAVALDTFRVGIVPGSFCFKPGQ